MTSKVEEVGGSTAATPAALNRNPAKGGLAWSQCALVQIEGQDAYAKFGGGGHGDVPTVRGAAIIPDGGNVVWQLKIEKKFASSPMRIGVQHPQVRVGLNWNDRECRGKAWYMDSQGDMYDGPSIYTETDAEYRQGDTVQVSLGYNRLTYTINGNKARGELEGIKGEVQLAVQLFHKGDKIVLVSQHVPDEEEEKALEEAEELRHQEFLERKQKDMQREERELAEKREAEEAEKRRAEEEEAAAAAAAAEEEKRKAEEEEEAERKRKEEEEEAERRRQEEEEAAAAEKAAAEEEYTEIGGDVPAQPQAARRALKALEPQARDVQLDAPEVVVSMEQKTADDAAAASQKPQDKSGPCPCC